MTPPWFSPMSRKQGERSSGDAAVAPARDRRPHLPAIDVHLDRLDGSSGDRPTIGPCPRAARPTAHEVLAAVLQIRDGSLQVLPGSGPGRRTPGAGRCPAGGSATTRTSRPSVRRQLAEKVDVREVTHVEQLAVFSAPTGCRAPGASPPRSSGWCPPTPTRPCPPTPRGTRVDALPDHGVRPRRDRRAPPATGCAPSSPTPTSGSRWRRREFTISALRELYAAALGHPVSATNLQRVLTRRAVLEPTGAMVAARARGRTARGAVPVRRAGTLRVTDAFAVLRPPGEHARAAVP